jgi:hypothetical protein
LVAVAALSLAAFAALLALLAVRIHEGVDPLLGRSGPARRVVVRKVIEHVEQVQVLPASAPAPPPSSAAVTVSGGASAAPTTRTS